MAKKPRGIITKEQIENHEFCPGCLRATPNGSDDYKNFISGKPTKTCRGCRNSVIKSVAKKTNKIPMKMSKKNEVLSQLVSDISDGILSLLSDKLAEFDKITVGPETKYQVKKKEKKEEIKEEIKEDQKVDDKPKKKLGRPRKVAVVEENKLEEEEDEDDDVEEDNSSVDTQEIVSKIKELYKQKNKLKK